jgi:hypothetical protein
MSRDSYSSGTVIDGSDGQHRSNRDSQVSNLSEDYHGDIQRSGSSSTQEDELDLRELDLREFERKKPSKAASLRKAMGKKAQSLGFHEKKNKDRLKRRKTLPGSDACDKKEKKNKGLITRFRDKTETNRTKQSGARVYQQIDDNTMSLFGMLPTIPIGQVEAADEKTPKGLSILVFLGNRFKSLHPNNLIYTGNILTDSRCFTAQQHCKKSYDWLFLFCIYNELLKWFR